MKGPEGLVQGAMRRLGNPLTAMSRTVRDDVMILVRTMMATGQRLGQTTLELRGAEKTILAIVKDSPNRTLDVAYDSVESIQRGDRLHSEEIKIKADDGTEKFYKRLTYVPKPADDQSPAPEEAPAPVEDPPKVTLQ